MISLNRNPEIGIRFLSPYFFPGRKSSSDKKQEFLASESPNTGITLWLGRGWKRIKTFIRAFKGSWSTGPEGAPWLCRKEDSWNDRTLTSGRFVWACRGGACRDKSRIFISFLLPLPIGLHSRVPFPTVVSWATFSVPLPRISKSNRDIYTLFFSFLFGFSFSPCWGITPRKDEIYRSCGLLRLGFTLLRGGRHSRAAIKVLAID